MSNPTSNQTPVDPFAADIAAFKAKQAERQSNQNEHKPKAEPQPEATLAAEAKVTPQLNPGPTTDSVSSLRPKSEPEPPRDQSSQAAKEPSWLERMKLGLTRSRGQMGEGLMTLLVGGREIDDELFEEIEDQLIMADLGVAATTQVMDALTQQVDRGDLIDARALRKALKSELIKLLEGSATPLELGDQAEPFVILVVGVNGVGKTTTIGKLATYFGEQGKNVMLAAGDTFRAAATEQLVIWGERNGIPVVHQSEGADSASVVFDAMNRAKSKKCDVLIIDTAGRLHNKSNLMEELKKVTRVIQKADPTAPHESLIVVDAGTGLNAIQQIKTFDEAVGLSGVVVTKLDGTAKGGMVFHVAKTTDLPIRFIGVGEKAADLRPFKPADLVEALLDSDD